MIPSLSQTGWMCGTEQQNKEHGIYNWKTGGWILNRNRQGVPFCNALFIHQRQICVDRTYLGLSCNSSSILGERDDGVEVGLVDRRTLKFQFLNTRKQGTVWSLSFSEEIGCSFSVLHPPSPKP